MEEDEKDPAAWSAPMEWSPLPPEYTLPMSPPDLLPSPSPRPSDLPLPTPPLLSPGLDSSSDSSSVPSATRQNSFALEHGPYTPVSIGHFGMVAAAGSVRDPVAVPLTSYEAAKWWSLQAPVVGLRQPTAPLLSPETAYALSYPEHYLPSPEEYPASPLDPYVR
jgi:hypothetical protein